MSGNFGYELDLTKLGSDEKEQIKSQIQTFKEDWQVIHNGSYYRCTDPRVHGEWDGSFFCGADFILPA